MTKGNVTELVPVGREPAAGREPSQSMQMRGLLGMARRQWLLVLIFGVIALGLSAVYLVIALPIYQARAQILLDTRKLQLFQQQSLIQDATYDTPAVESQMEVMRSEAIGATVVDDLKLMDMPEFTTGLPANPVLAFVARGMRRVAPDIAARLFGAIPVTRADRIRAAVSHLRNNVQVQRVRTTYVIEIGFTSRDPAMAARVANGVADAYILEQTQSKQYTTRRATNWLEERMSELKERAVNAEKAVEDFRTKNNLVRLGSVVVSEQQLADLNLRVSKERERAAEIKSRLERLQEIMASPVPDAGMTAWLNNDIINKLRGQYSETTRREAELTARLGATHESVIKAKKEERQIERSAAEEMRRIAETWKAEYEGAEARAATAEAALKGGQVQNEASRQEQGALNMLESTAKTYRALHDTFLQRYVEANTQQNFQSTEARVITPASSGFRYAPNPQQVLTTGAILGLMLGAGAAFLRERFYEVLRTPEEAQRVLGVECFGVLPLVEAAPGHELPKPAFFAPTTGAARVIPPDLGIVRQVLHAPFSRFTETVRGIKIAVDANEEERVIGITSAVPGEGKSTVAANLAQLTANGSNRVLLIDGDLRQPSLTRSMAPNADAGLLEVLDGSFTLADAVWHDATTGMDFLPAVIDAKLSNASEVLAGRGMIDLLARARELYDYVFIDFPPLAPVVDAKAAAHLMDGFVLVAEWGETSQTVIAEALASAKIVQSKLLGVVLNRADPGALKQLESYKGSRYHQYYTSFKST